MPKQQHHPKFTQRFFGGANRDAGKELLGQQEAGQGARGQYVDGRNQRSFSDGGDNFYSKKIDGETLFYDNVDNRCSGATNSAISGTWECIGAIDVKGRIFECWAEENAAQDPIIRIDGLIVCQSSELPFVSDTPLQMDKNESCVGGEVMINDRNSPVIIFNVEDMLKNSGRLSGTCTDKYFADFEINEFTTNLQLSPDILKFRQLVNKGASQGLPPGQYAYKMRFFDADNNKSQFCISTPLITVTNSNSSLSNEFPYVKTKGASSGSNTAYGIELKFRITNQFNYTGVEIARIAFNGENALGFLPETQLIWTIDDLQAEEINVITFTDAVNRSAVDLTGNGRGASESDVAITDEEDTEVLESIDSAGAMKYFNNRLILANVKYASRDTEDTLTFSEINSKKVFPVIQKMDQEGHNDPYNSTYYKSFMTSERYGLSVIPIDGKSSRAFAVTPSGSDPSGNEYKNYKMPNRRTSTASETDTYSYLGTPTAAPEDGSAATNVHEVFDLVDAKTLTDKCSFRNVYNGGSKSKSKVNEYGCADPGFGTQVEGDEIGYDPYTPVNPNDTNVDGHNYRSLLEVYKTNNGSPVDYNPKGYGPNYYSQGLAISGISNYPSWVKAFAIARSEPANRVVAQGLGFYAIRSAGQGPGPTFNSKDRSRFYLYAPDTDTQIGIDPTIVTDMINNPADYEIELVSPLGFFSDVFSGEFLGISGSLGRWRGIDMISYARILYEDGTINTGDTTGTIGKSGYVSFGKWRNSSEPAIFPGGDATDASGLKRFKVVATTAKTTANGLSSGAVGRGNFMEVRLSTNVYGSAIPAAEHDFNTTSMKNWHEPVYIVNIIKNEADVKDSNINSFINTGTYQKIESVIGNSNGLDDQSFDLIDERWEDCISGLSAFLSDAFLYVEEPNATEDKAWIDITFKTTAERNTIINDIINNGFHTTGGKNVYGVYTSTNTSNRFFTIDFSVLQSFSSNPDVFLPVKDSLIKVKYDNTKPIQVFGGDTYIGETIFCPIDMEGENEHGTNPVNNANDFRLANGFPYRKWEMNPRIYQINRTTGINNIQDRDDVDLMTYNLTTPYYPASVRQLAVMFTCESRLHLPYLYGTNGERSYFPDVHYVMRPFRWDGNGSIGDNNMFSTYESDYQDEASINGATGRWRRGGIRFLPYSNIDYSQSDTTVGLFSKPKTGFQENNEFCVRIVCTGQRIVNNPDTGGLKTFPALNIKDIADDTGGINFLWAALGGNKGENLYAFTENGSTLLLTDKRTLTQLDGAELAVMGTEDSTFIQQEIWLSKEIGMPGGNWQLAAWDNNILWWGDKDTAYRLEGNNLRDIGREKQYHSKLFTYLSKIIGSSKLASAFDERRNEYWMKVYSYPNIVTIGREAFNNPGAVGLPGTPTVIYPKIDLADIDGYVDDELSYVKLINDNVIINIPAGSHTIKICNGSEESFIIYLRDTVSGTTIASISTGQCISASGTAGGTWTISDIDEKDELKKALFVFSENAVEGGAWLGTFDYDFDKFVSNDNKVFGLKSLETYELNKGTQINGAAIEYEIVQVAAPGGKNEFIRIGVNSTNKPTKITFHDDPDSLIVSEMSESVFGTDWMRLYDEYENFIPRDAVSRDRRQSKLLVYKIFHNLEEDFDLINTTIQHKRLI